MSNIPMRNTTPLHGIRIPFETHTLFITKLFLAVGMQLKYAELMGEMLATADSRCVYSHGSLQVLDYLQQIREGRVNSSPKVTIAQESDTTAVLDGDGGMGYGPAHQGMSLAVEKALKHGIGAVTTRNHYHFGAAGNYSRMAIKHNCVGWALSAHRYNLDSNQVIMGASGGSPMSLAFPTQTQPPLVLDMGTVFMNYEDSLFQKYYGLFAKSLGLGVAIQAIAGILAGIWKPELQSHSKWIANQGTFLLAFKIDNFMPLDEFQHTLDFFIAQARRMRPFPGMPHAELPGGMEWRWEKENLLKGVPLDDDLCLKLNTVAESLNIETPFKRYESTRF